jgi:hypothetical protein
MTSNASSPVKHHLPHPLLLRFLLLHVLFLWPHFVPARGPSLDERDVSFSLLVSDVPTRPVLGRHLYSSPGSRRSCSCLLRPNQDVGQPRVAVEPFGEDTHPAKQVLMAHMQDLQSTYSGHTSRSRDAGRKAALRHRPPIDSAIPFLQRSQLNRGKLLHATKRPLTHHAGLSKRLTIARATLSRRIFLALGKSANAHCGIRLGIVTGQNVRQAQNRQSMRPI